MTSLRTIFLILFVIPLAVRPMEADAAVYADREVVSNLTAVAGGQVNLYAGWAPNTYTVKYNKNGGSGTMADQSFTYDVAQNLRAIAFSRTGYTFDGWATSAGADATYRGGASVKNLTAVNGGVVTLYAVWARNNYTVRFNANGGSGTMADQAFKYSTAQNLRANSFTRSGYSFSGWAVSATGAKVYSDRQSVNNLATAEGAVVNLYAVWTRTSNNWYIQFHSNGGSGTMANETFQFGVTKAISANSFTRSGYTFVGWAAGPSGSVKWEARESVRDLTTIAEAKVHLYAVWFPNGYAETFHDGFECSQNPWTTSSYSPWTFETTTTAYDTNNGSDIASSGQLSGFNTSWAQTTGIVGPCTLRFHYRKDFANGTFSVLCDGSTVFSDSTAARSSTWIGKEVSIPSGTHTIRVQFTQTSGTAYNGVDVDNLYIVYDTEVTQ